MSIDHAGYGPRVIVHKDGSLALMRKGVRNVVLCMRKIDRKVY